MDIIRYPELYTPKPTDIMCFMAGGCGNTTWRDIFIEKLNEKTLNHLILIDPYNPKIDDPKKQIRWEFNYLNLPNIIFSVYFDKYTDQPISMYELGRATTMNIPCIVSLHSEAPKLLDIKYQCKLVGIKGIERTPEEHAMEVIKTYNQIKYQMK